jgi:hypothetical protein
MLMHQGKKKASGSRVKKALPSEACLVNARPEDNALPGRYRNPARLVA